MDAKHVLPELASAKDKLADAERDLERVVSEIVATPPADKTGVTPVVERAFEQVRRAREALEELETLLKREL